MESMFVADVDVSTAIRLPSGLIDEPFNGTTLAPRRKLWTEGDTRE